jgi:hypothetical protein
MIYGDQGDFESAYRLVDEATPITKAAGRLSLEGPLLIQRGMVECWQGAWDACLETAHAAHNIAERIEGRYILAMSLALDGFARFMAFGDFTALDELRQSVTLLDNHCARLHMSWNYALLAEALAFAGACDEAFSAAKKALSRAAEHDTLGEVAALRVLIHLTALGGDLDGAEKYMGRAIAVAEAKRSKREVLLARLRWAEVLCAGGRRLGALPLLNDIVPQLHAMGMQFYAARARELMAQA